MTGFAVGHLPMPSTHCPSTPPSNGKCVFWTLPPELRQHVLHYAYSDDEQPVHPWTGTPVRYVSTISHEHKAINTPLPVWCRLPDCPLTNLKVSRAYLEEAAEALYYAKSWTFRSQFGLHAFLHHEPARLVKHIRSIRIWGRNCHVLRVGDASSIAKYAPMLQELDFAFEVYGCWIHAESNDEPAERMLLQPWTKTEIEALPLIRALADC